MASLLSTNRDKIHGMPKYAKYLKDVVTNKTKLGDIDTVALTKECSSVATSNMPEKLKDLRSFTPSIQIGANDLVHDLVIWERA